MMKVRRRSKKGFTLLEVMLSMAILSIIVYTVFIVFDRSMDALDNVFVDTQKYEAVRVFFDQISKELSSASIGKSSDTDDYFRGGPHWVEFTTPLLEDVDIEDYIKKGVSGGLKTEPRKVHYYSARISDYSSIFGEIGKNATYTLFQHHLYRILPEDSLHENLFTYLELGTSQKKTSVTYREVPFWLDHYTQVKNLKKEANVEALLPEVNITEMLVARAVQFRYYFEVEQENGTVTYYYQDWWDSRVKYPSYLSEATAGTLFNQVYDSTLYDTYGEISEERKRRYGSGSIGNPGSDTTPSKFSFDESWLYENESTQFLAFDDSTKTIFNQAPLNSYLETLAVSKSDDGDDPDPWFQKPPTAVEIRVYLYDKSKAIKDIPETNNPIVVSDWGAGLQPSFPNAYRGEFFTIRIYMPTKSPYIVNYSRDLIIE